MRTLMGSAGFSALCAAKVSWMEIALSRAHLALEKATMKPSLWDLTSNP